jgi:hypothetical protein
MRAQQQQQPGMGAVGGNLTGRVAAQGNGEPTEGGLARDKASRERPFFLCLSFGSHARQLGGLSPEQPVLGVPGPRGSGTVPLDPANRVICGSPEWQGNHTST